MQDYPSQVNAAFVSRHGEGKNLNNMQRLNMRYEVAKAVLSGEHSNIVKELERKAQAQHDIEMDEWNMTLEDISLAEDVSQYVFAPQIPDTADPPSILGLETTFLRLSSPFSRPSAPTLVVMLLSSPETPRRMMVTKGFSPRESIFSLSQVV
jgi:hypothetical protein